MSDNTQAPVAHSDLPAYAVSQAPVHGLLAEYDAVGPLMHACEAVRDAGYTKWDAHTPFPVHGLDAAMGVRPTRLPWLVLACGLTGMGLGLLMQWYMNAYDYPWIISGKPLFSLPAFVPVAFEITVLLSGFACFFGTLGLNGLPSFFHPLFTRPRFRRATDDRFFVYIEAQDPIFDAARAERLLAGTHPLHQETVHYETQGLHTRLPAGTTGIAAILAVLSILPFALFARARESTSLKPSFHLNPPAPVKDDMDRQYKFRAQASNWFFEDGRAMRDYPDGAVASEDPTGPTPFLTGKRDAMPSQASTIAPPELRPTHGQNLATTTPIVRTQPPMPAPEEAGGYLTTFPPEVPLTKKTMDRGEERFNIYCSVCHGVSGQGDGMVARHAEALQEGTWVAPSSLHDARVRALPLGDLYNTVTHGVRNMPGYGHLIEPMDRWAIVMYVRALQLSQHAASTDVPQDVLPTLQ
jgi:mono/diheme cytochrome c family protein